MPTKIHVCHAVKPNFIYPPKYTENFNKEFVKVAEMRYIGRANTDKLAKVFKMTNTIESPWYESKSPLFTMLPKEPTRSTSTGDVIIFEYEDGSMEYFGIALVGFEKIHEIPAKEG